MKKLIEVDSELWKNVKVKSIIEDIKMKDLFNIVLSEWLK